MNAPVMVELDDKMTDPLEIAAKELREQKVPFIVRRYLPVRGSRGSGLGRGLGPDRAEASQFRGPALRLGGRLGCVSLPAG